MIEITRSTVARNRRIVPHDRQFTDEKIRGIAERQEVIGVAFDAWMLTPNFDEVRFGNSRTSLATVVDHICQMSGSARHAAIGTDLDGSYGREQSPHDLDTIADLQKIPAILVQRGYSPDDIAGIMHGNWIGLLRRSWQ